MIGYKRRRTKGIICRGNRPSDIDSNASAQDDDSEGKEVTREDESKPKREKHAEMRYPCIMNRSFQVPFFSRL